MTEGARTRYRAPVTGRKRFRNGLMLLAVRPLWCAAPAAAQSIAATWVSPGATPATGMRSCHTVRFTLAGSPIRAHGLTTDDFEVRNGWVPHVSGTSSASEAAICFEAVDWGEVTYRPKAGGVSAWSPERTHTMGSSDTTPGFGDDAAVADKAWRADRLPHRAGGDGGRPVPGANFIWQRSRCPRLCMRKALMRLLTLPPDSSAPATGAHGHSP